MFGLVPFDRKHRGLQSSQNSIFDINSVMENFFNDSVFPSFYCNSSQMKVDIRETDDAYWLDADLPGIAKDQVELEVDDDRLTIRVNQSEQKDEKTENYVRRERYQSTMSRSFGLSSVDRDSIKAEMKDGVLHVKLPKADNNTSRGKTIPID